MGKKENVYAQNLVIYTTYVESTGVVNVRGSNKEVVDIYTNLGS